MRNNRHLLKLSIMLLLTGIYVPAASAQPCTQLLIASYTPGIVCTGKPLNLSANTITGATYSWTGPSGFFSTGQNPILPSVMLTQSGSYIVTAVAGSCTYKDTVNVTVNQSPTTPVVTLMAPPCKGSALSIQLQSSGGTGITYAMYTPNGAPFTPIFSLSSSHSGIYKAIASLPNGCKSDTGYFPLQVIDLPAPTLLADTPICRGDTLDLYVMNNTPVVDNYYWNTPNANPFYTSPVPLHLPNVTVGGFYAVQTVLDGCLSPMAYVLIGFKPSVYATVSATADGQIHPGYTELTFTAHIANGGNAPTIRWFRNGAPIAGATDTVYKGILFADIFPMDWFYAQVKKDSACGGISYSDTIQVNEVLNVSSVNEQSIISLYPNPNNGIFMLQMPAQERPVTIEIANAVGQKVYSNTVSLTNRLEVELPAGVPNGIYMLQVRNSERTYVSRFTLNR